MPLSFASLIAQFPSFQSIRMRSATIAAGIKYDRICCIGFLPNAQDKAAGTGRLSHRQPALPPLAFIRLFGLPLLVVSRFIVPGLHEERHKRFADLQYQISEWD